MDSSANTPPFEDEYMPGPKARASQKADPPKDDNRSSYEKVCARLEALDCLTGEGVVINEVGDSLVRCPVHDDRKASLSIREGDDGHVLINCFAGCSFSEIVKALGLPMADFFPGPTVYSYVDLDGNVRHQTVRTEPKAFKQRRPDGRGGFIWDLKGVDLLLYNLPAIQGREEVLIVEGEKDVEVIRRIGVRDMVATTNAMGAGKWRDAYAAQLVAAGVKRVSILPDNDAPGIQHAWAVAGSCQRAGLRARIVQLPGLKDKEDVSDWLPTYGAGQLSFQVRKAPWLEPVPPAAETKAPDAKAPAKPTIMVSGDLSAMTDEAWKATVAANTGPTLYQRGTLPSRLEIDENKVPLTRPLTPERLRRELALASRWMRPKGKLMVEVPPPMIAVTNMLATPQPPLPVLDRVVETPVFTAAGRIRLEAGYDPEGRTFYMPPADLEIPPVSERPSADEVEEAVVLLLDLLRDFAFVGEADRTHAVALMLLPFVREMIEGPTPNHDVEAPSPGTGKTLLVNVALLPSLGRTVPAMAEGRDDDEWRKRITAKLFAASPAIFLDNIKRPLDSGAVAAAITALRWEDRILGKSEIQAVPVKCVWVTSANNPTFSLEIARRSVRIRLVAAEEQPWLRTGFTYPDLRGYARANRGRLIWACLTLGQAWVAADRPADPSKTLGMFEDWVRVIGGILKVAGVPGFLENLAELYEEADSESAEHREFFAAWWLKHQGNLVTVPTLLDLPDGLPGTVVEAFDRQAKLGYYLRKLRDKSIRLGRNGPTVVAVAGGKEATTKRTLWRLRVAQ